MGDKVKVHARLDLLVCEPGPIEAVQVAPAKPELARLVDGKSQLTVIKSVLRHSSSPLCNVGFLQKFCLLAIPSSRGRTYAN